MAGRSFSRPASLLMASQRRLYLFDIDSTLITTGGAGISAQRDAFRALWGRDDPYEAVEVAGRTDRAILRDVLAVAGVLDGAGGAEGEEAFAEELRRFKRAYLRRLPRTLANRPGRVLPGVVPLLQALRRDPSATVALGTGNFRAAAALKLRHFGLDGYFCTAGSRRPLGGFGDATEDRATLIAQAVRAAERALGRHAAVFVIGDTAHDVAAARANRAVAVAVATGPTPAESLAAAGADLVLPTLEAAAAIL